MRPTAADIQKAKELADKWRIDHSTSGGESVVGDIAQALAEVRDAERKRAVSKIRCWITGNPYGTDTIERDKPCSCSHCHYARQIEEDR